LRAVQTNGPVEIRLCGSQKTHWTGLSMCKIQRFDLLDDFLRYRSAIHRLDRRDDGLSVGWHRHARQFINLGFLKVDTTIITKCIFDRSESDADSAHKTVLNLAPCRVNTVFQWTRFFNHWNFGFKLNAFGCRRIKTNQSNRLVMV